MDSFASLKERILSGQIIATSHDLTPNGGLAREIPLFQGNLGWCNIIIWPDAIFLLPLKTFQSSHGECRDDTPIFGFRCYVSQDSCSSMQIAQ